MRALKRRLSNVVFARMLADQHRRDHASATGPGGHLGNDSDSSATDSQPQRRLFGQATSRTRHQQAQNPRPRGVLT